MVEHFGHFVQSPSGISRLRVLDLPELILGFFGSCVIADSGGVNAGSMVSNPSVFFVNEVVSILFCKQLSY